MGEHPGICMRSMHAVRTQCNNFPQEQFHGPVTMPTQKANFSFWFRFSTRGYFKWGGPCCIRHSLRVFFSAPQLPALLQALIDILTHGLAEGYTYWDYISNSKVPPPVQNPCVRPGSRDVHVPHPC